MLEHRLEKSSSNPKLFYLSLNDGRGVRKGLGRNLTPFLPLNERVTAMLLANVALVGSLTSH